MNIVAVVAIRDDDDYVQNCLTHLAAQDVNFIVINNGMRQKGLEALQHPEVSRRLVDYVDLAFNGTFELRRQLEMKERLIDQLDADWVIHVDVDEIMHSRVPGETLREAISRLDATGATVIDFSEYVFLPVLEPYLPGHEGWQPSLHYYFFSPAAPRLLRARRHRIGLSTLPGDSGFGSGGHTLFGPSQKLASENMVLRHYLARDQEHARQKYTQRLFCQDELDIGWHFNRIGHSPKKFDLPRLSRLKTLDRPDSCSFDDSQPENLHFWQWNRELDTDIAEIS